MRSETAACFQRCVGMDAFNATFSTTYEIDEQYGTHYHDNFKKFVEYVQDNDLTVDGAMTDPKGDRSLAPHAQADPDMYLHVVERRPDLVSLFVVQKHTRQASATPTKLSLCLPSLWVRMIKIMLLHSHVQPMLKVFSNDCWPSVM